MGLELRRDKQHNLRSKWWYGRYMINGKRYFTNLGVEVKGKVPKNIRKLLQDHIRTMPGHEQAVNEKAGSSKSRSLCPTIRMPG